MTDPTAHTGATPGRDAAGMPRWVKATGVIALIVIVVVIIALLVGGGHGPSRHAESIPDLLPAASQINAAEHWLSRW